MQNTVLAEGIVSPPIMEHGASPNNVIAGNLAVHTQDLTKTYGEVRALTKLDLKVPERSIFGLLGPNGAGKTTTIRLLLGLIKPTSGKGTILGEDIERQSVEVRKRVGYLAQIPSYYTYMTAREILLFKLRFYHKGDKTALERRVQDTLELVELADKADRPIRGFSGGERQRLGIAQAWVHEPELLILDEPAANLDPMGRRDVLNLMAKLRERSTIIYSTHILNDVQHISDTVAILRKGELLAQAPMRELLGGSGVIQYEVVVRGPYQEAYERIKGMPWVTAVTLTQNDTLTTIEVSVTDDKIAEEQLPKLALGGGEVVLASFERKKLELEDVFMQIVEGDKAES